MSDPVKHAQMGSEDRIKILILILGGSLNQSKRKSQYISGGKNLNHLFMFLELWGNLLSLFIWQPN